LTSSPPLILAHGGAGLRRLTPVQATCLADALAAGYAILARGGRALTAVESTIGLLEQSGLFNAGRGANRQLDGVQRMDASIMEGADLKAGAVASIEGILHPITAARLVMEDTNHVLLVGPPATRFAQHCQLEQLPRVRLPRRRSGLSPRPSLAATQTIRIYRGMLKSQRTLKDQHGTVGAVALDRSGTVAAGASTGGIDSMLPGRVGDSPLIGCGVYADNQSGAVSMTGMGEGIIRLAIAKTICDHLAMGKSPAVAARQVLRMLVSRIQGSAGALVLSPDGRFAIRHVTPHMAAGWWNGTGRPTVRGQFP
jgi:beta-aspartyl-peptidase (threonine type)